MRMAKLIRGLCESFASFVLKHFERKDRKENPQKGPKSAYVSTLPSPAVSSS